jgi:hypothetical protein
MKTQTVPISKVKLNPNNPRLIKDDKFKKLVASIQGFPEMLQIRPIVVNADMVVLGGNMRLRACKEAGLKEVPIIVADNIPEDRQAEFIIKDNVGFGEWDWEMLANQWDADLLTDWGLEVPNWSIGIAENDMNEDQIDINEEFDPIGVSKGQQRVVFIFDGKDEAESWLAQFPSLPLKKMNMAWQVDLSTQSIL